MQQAHVFISGRVQGVSYRYFVLQNAQELGITGWVRNIDDGRVEAVFQGEKGHIDQMLALCKEGPSLAEVNHIDNTWEEGKELFDQFSIT